MMALIFILQKITLLKLNCLTIENTVLHLADSLHMNYHFLKHLDYFLIDKNVFNYDEIEEDINEYFHSLNEEFFGKGIDNLLPNENNYIKGKNLCSANLYLFD